MAIEEDRFMKSSARSRYLLAALALAVGFASWWALRDRCPGLMADFRIVVPKADDAAGSVPFFKREVLNPVIDLPMVHAGTLVEFDDGSLRAVWFGGTTEGDNDVSLYTSSKVPGQAWTNPRLLLDRETVMASMRRYVVSLGNPVLIKSGPNDLALLFVTISAGRWSGSSINVARSADRGETWSKPTKLALGPFFNLSDLPRNPPVPLVSGDWVVPIYHEFMGKFPEILRINLTGERPVYAKSRMYGGLAYLQPTIAALSGSRAVAFYRDFTAERQTFRAETSDSARRWSLPQTTGLPNPDSAVCVLRLMDGRLLMAFNDSDDNRHELSLALSKDEGVSWKKLAVLDEGNGRDVCYPYMILGHDGRVRMLYTFRGRQICYAEFNMAWIAGLESSLSERGGLVP